MQILGPTSNQTGGTTSDLALFKEFLSDVETAIPLNSNFLIGFLNIPDGLESFGDSVIGDLEPNKWKIQEVKDSLINVIKKPVTDGSRNYCLFAQGVNLPSENLNVSRTGFDGNAEQAGGLLPGLVAKDRTGQGTLETTFLETNSSFIDFVIRPWVIAVSHYGLRGRKEGSIKTDMSVIFFDKYRNNAIRKIYTFHQCAPVQVSGITATYGDNTLVLPKVNWAYNYYTITS